MNYEELFNTKIATHLPSAQCRSMCRHIDMLERAFKGVPDLVIEKRLLLKKLERARDFEGKQECLDLILQDSGLTAEEWAATRELY